MNLILIIWLLDVIPAIGVALTLLGVALILLYPLLLIIRNCELSDHYPSDHEEIKKDFAPYIATSKWLVYVGAVLLTMAVFIPSKGTLYAMAAAYGIQEVAASEDVKRLTGKSFTLLEKKMDEYLAEDKEN